jgi:hypothetical protein
MTKIYIAGPMTGIPDYNRPAFNEYAAKLVTQGHTVLNPATLPDGLEQSEYMDICLAMVRACDELHALTGWQESAGATVEIHYARKIGKTVNEVGAVQPVDPTLEFIRRHVAEWPSDDVEGVFLDYDGEIRFTDNSEYDIWPTEKPTLDELWFARKLRDVGRFECNVYTREKWEGSK